MSARDELHVANCACDYSTEGDRWQSHTSHSWDPRCRALNEEPEPLTEREVHALCGFKCACGAIALDGKECAECWYARIEREMEMRQDNAGGSRTAAATEPHDAARPQDDAK